jgi:hypothetical protein
MVPSILFTYIYTVHCKALVPVNSVSLTFFGMQQSSSSLTSVFTPDVFLWFHPSCPRPFPPLILSPYRISRKPWICPAECILWYIFKKLSVLQHSFFIYTNTSLVTTHTMTFDEWMSVDLGDSCRLEQLASFLRRHPELGIGTTCHTPQGSVI